MGMNYTILQKPKNDKDMIYDTEMGLYKLTSSYAKKEFEITYRDDNVLGRRLKKISRATHTYLMWKSAPENKQVIDFFLHRTEEGRNFVKAILTSALEADLESGYYSLSQQAPINFDRQKQMENRVDVQTESIINDSERYVGFNLFVQFPFPFILFNFVQNIINQD